MCAEMKMKISFILFSKTILLYKKTSVKKPGAFPSFFMIPKANR
jgi:hypothetical protein